MHPLPSLKKPMKIRAVHRWTVSGPCNLILHGDGERTHYVSKLEISLFRNLTSGQIPQLVTIQCGEKVIWQTYFGLLPYQAIDFPTPLHGELGQDLRVIIPLPVPFLANMQGYTI